MKIYTAMLCVSLLGCSQRPSEGPELINKEASLTGELPFAPFQWKVISSGGNRLDGTMVTLYGNDMAVRHAREASSAAYPEGSVLSLVTWSQKPDVYWFGARIPAGVKEVEFVTTGPNSPLAYIHFEGTPLKPTTPDAALARARVDFILAQQPSLMP